MNLNDKIDLLKGEVVSVLLDLNKNHLLKESYNGTLTETGEDYIILETNNPNFHIKTLIIKKNLILSVWIYSENGKDFFNNKLSQ
jgi:hypothetical protein